MGDQPNASPGKSKDKDKDNESGKSKDKGDQPDASSQGQEPGNSEDNGGVSPIDSRIACSCLLSRLRSVID